MDHFSTSTLATEDPVAIERFYVDQLGFLTSDYVRDTDGKILVCWMRSNHEHHTLACFRTSRQGIDHHSYEAGDWSVIKDWCDRMGNRRIPLMWDPDGTAGQQPIRLHRGSGRQLDRDQRGTRSHVRPPGSGLAARGVAPVNRWGRGIMRVPPSDSLRKVVS